MSTAKNYCRDCNETFEEFQGALDHNDETGHRVVGEA